MSSAEPQPVSAGDQLDQEIASLKEQVSALRSRIKIECSTIVSATSTQNIIRSSSTDGSLFLPASPARTSPKPPPQPQPPQKLVDRSIQQSAYVQQCLYRISNSITAFKVRDPDPNAVDGGHVLGLRFEIMSRGSFLRPYYVMLNRPYSGVGAKHLRVHRHTVPQAVPLAGLAARHLPSPKTRGDPDAIPPAQDLDRFARSLRREIMRWHNRLGVAADLRRDLGLHDGRRVEQAHGPSDVVAIRFADIQAKHLELMWADNRSGRVVMDDDGKVEKVMVVGRQGRDWETTRELFSKNDRIEDVARKIVDYPAG